MTEPKIILWDIETSHNLVASFRLFEDFTPPENIVQERFIICAAWKVLGEKKVNSVSVLDNPTLFKKDPYNDFHVLKTLHEVLSSADVIIAHNGDKFDLKFTEARMLIQGLPPLPPITKIDTLKVAKKRLLFNSNKLDYLGKVLGVGRKIKTEGGLWLKVLQGDEEAIKKMVIYNKKDVELLEKVFLKLRPFVGNHISRETFGKGGCPRCGSLKIQSRGVHRTITRTYQRLHCQGCGGWFRKIKPEASSASVRNI